MGLLNLIYGVLKRVKRERRLTLEMIRKLPGNLGIPAESLIGA